MDRHCINCNRTDDQFPLIEIIYKGDLLYICPQCLPNLIHDPASLSDKLPGLDILPAKPHGH